MIDIGLQPNAKKCNVIYVKQGETKHDIKAIQCYYNPWKKIHRKFLGILENVRQEERRTIECDEKTYLQHLSTNRCQSCDCLYWYALAVLKYPKWTQHSPLTELRRTDREARKIMVTNGGKQQASSTPLLYVSRKRGGRALQSVKGEYKVKKIKAAMKSLKQ